MNQLTETAATIGLAIIGVAILAVLVSRNSNTVGVVGALGNSFSRMLGTAISPVSGQAVGDFGLGGYFSGGFGY